MMFLLVWVFFYCFVGRCFSDVSLGDLPAGHLEVVLRITLLVQDHLRAERLLLLRCVLEILLEEGDGDGGGGVSTHECRNVLVARLNHLAGVDVVPRSLGAEKVAESPNLEIHLLLGVALLGLQVGHGYEQVRGLMGGQAHTIALVFCTYRAARASVGTPDGVALAAGDEGVVDSLVGLGLFRRHDGNGVVDGGGFGGLGGLHVGLRFLGACD